MLIAVCILLVIITMMVLRDELNLSPRLFWLTVLGASAGVLAMGVIQWIFH